MICSSCLLVFSPRLYVISLDGYIYRLVIGMLIVSPYAFSYRQYAIWPYRCKNVSSTCLFMCLPTESTSSSHIDAECCVDVVSFAHSSYVSRWIDVERCPDCVYLSCVSPDDACAYSVVLRSCPQRVRDLVR